MAHSGGSWLSNRRRWQLPVRKGAAASDPIAVGALRLGTAFLVALGTEDARSRAALAARYFGTSTTGQAINEGVMAIVFAIGLGILVEISRSVYSRKKDA